jgi:hypothetical protein
MAYADKIPKAMEPIAAHTSITKLKTSANFIRLQFDARAAPREDRRRGDFRRGAVIACCDSRRKQGPLRINPAALTLDSVAK